MLDEMTIKSIRARQQGMYYEPACETCDGICCRIPTVNIPWAEAGSRRWLLTSVASYSSYPLRQAVLAKRADGSCVYFDRERGRCTTYHDRPAVCRMFRCTPELLVTYREYDQDRRAGKTAYNHNIHRWVNLPQRGGA